jgi:type IV secretion system protein VirD4
VDAATSASDFDLRDLRKRYISIYLGVSPDELDRVAPLYNLLLQQLIDLNVRDLPNDTTPIPVLVILDEFARLGRASVIASAFSYVAGYGIRLLPVIQSRSQLRGVYGEHVADEIVANCGVEVAFTPKELRVANELSDRIGYVGQESVTRSLTINGSLANRSKSISEQRRALMLPQELMQFPMDRLILLRGGIPPVIGTKVVYFKSRFFKKRTFPSPVIPPIAMQARRNIASPQFRDMTDEEAEGKPAYPLTQDDIRTEDYPSFFADLLTLDRDGQTSFIIEEGDENG